MNERLDPALERALAALQDEQPDARFERALRARFLGASSARRRPRAWVTALAAAAGLALALWTWRAARGEGADAWRVLAVEGEVTLDGRALELADLESGGRLRSGPDGGLRLVLGKRLALALGPDSDIELPAQRASHAAWRLRANAGHLALRTGPEFAGARLQVLAPDAEVEVLGTRFAVDLYEDGTCVCCSEGRVDVRSLRAEAARAQVPPGGMAYAHAQGGITTGEVQPEHSSALDALEDVFD